VKIYTPDALQKQLFNLRQKAPELVAVAAVGAFGGIRIREISRLDWTQLNQALQTGFIEMSGDQTKTGVSRYVPVSDNLKAWLLACRKESGPVPLCKIICAGR
jgi:integrase